VLSQDNDPDYKFVLLLEEDSIYKHCDFLLLFTIMLLILLLTITLRHCPIENNCSVDVAIKEYL